ncbi:MAG: acetoacetate--CoA ligase [Casimicrobium sp.]
MNEQPLWSPSSARIDSARITACTQLLRDKYQQQFPDYWSLWRWSVANKETFWREVWDFCGVVGEQGERVLVDGHLMPGAQWFPDARLNYAENLLQKRGGGDALVFWNEQGDRRRVSHDALYAFVAQAQTALREAGVVAEDRVASLLPNIPEAAIAMLGATSLGAVWSSSSPDFGVQGVLDRFTQIAPKILFAVNGYFYNGKVVDVRAKVLEIVANLPSVKRVVWVEYVDDLPVPSLDRKGSVGTGLPAMNTVEIAGKPAPTERAAHDAAYVGWTKFLANAASEITFERFPFNHPLVVVYSSGTTGMPKCMVHGVGGTLLQHLKEHVLHSDVHDGDRVFYFSTTGWVMWNWLISGLATGATCMLYDGSPFAERGRILWDYAEAERFTLFGTSAKYIDAIKKAGVVPRRSHVLPALRAVLSTGSPLLPESFDYVYECVKPDVHLASISGGTDIMACFAAGNPVLPVYRGELQCRGLGMATDVFDDDGHSLVGEMGELVCTQTFPSIPLYFMNDPDGSRLRSSYFERFPGLWCHGDWCEITAHDGMVITGRSDATLNPGGVRIGTAEIYRQVETLPEVVESIVIGQNFQGDARVVLFVKLADGLMIDDLLREKIKQRIRENTTPRHVPAKIVQVADIPRTKSNKIVELAVRDVVHGRMVKNLEALANPEALELFRNRVELTEP